MIAQGTPKKHSLQLKDSQPMQVSMTLLHHPQTPRQLTGVSSGVPLPGQTATMGVQCNLHTCVM